LERTMTTETLSFNAEVGKILDIVAKSLYSNAEVFLRELISNSSDALEKWRFANLTDTSAESGDEAEIVLQFDKEGKILTIADNGIGMTRQELIENLGTIASSGTQRFIENLTDKSNNLIGQFGVGFYSCFMVADRVAVDSVKDGECWRWESDGKGSFTISQIDELPFARGTKITLFMRDDAASEYCDRYRIENIVEHYSNHIRFPIMLVETKDDGEIKKERINNGTAIWTKERGQVTEEEHQDFFRSVAHVGGAPWLTMHNRNESRDVNFTNLLYIPTVKPFDLFHPDRRCSVKLYVKGVFVAEDSDKLSMLPRYLRFVKGVIDAEDQPLSVSRDSVQQNSRMNAIRSSVTKRVLGELKKIAQKEPERYKQFWDNFGAVVKEGLCEALDTESREGLMEICRFRSTTHDVVSIDEYIGRMKEDQKHIYYLIGDNCDAMMHSPQIEGLIKQGIEVLLLTDSVDDFWTHVIFDHKDKPFKSATSADVAASSNESEEDKKEETDSNEENLVKFIDFMKAVLGSAVADVAVSKKLTDSPACLAIPEGSFNMRMERFLIEQKQLNERRAKIMEINKRHPVIVRMVENLARNGENDPLKEYVRVLFDSVCIAEGEPIGDVLSYSKRSVDLLSRVV
jgi:molecular chaperone HtpG